MDDEDKDKIVKEEDKKIDETQSEGEKQPLDESKPANNAESIISEQKNLETNQNKEETKEHQVIHKKDDRLHIYVRQDKYKGELKSKNWVGRLYIDGKQKISSSGTSNLEEAIPILEKWFDDIHAQKEKEKEQENFGQTDTPEQSTPTSEQTTSLPIQKTTESTKVKQDTNSPTFNKDTSSSEKSPSSILEKFKNIKFQKPSFGKKATFSGSPGAKKKNKFAQNIQKFSG